ncbi:TIGR03758 family integrating conjugative element protein [Pseudomonas sp. GOM7]|uniref:TIGR03758 family integrating conjugative element protein n=1 Tax=Pseudomonas sp. GOM7 TaxID=2998079 RepID=UPI00227BD177|nr:TIGR03758 family integrating conjugative element protein [Pseudomonas sp. GOM7]WAJ37265.1 TIGR03758 family integrating conjugative element protein [Pseudomonas sp. GOM7]
MNQEQKAAFELGAGYSADDLSLAISGFVAVLLFLFVAWVLLSAYRGWADRSLALKKFGGTLLRLAVLLFVVLLIISR